VIAHFAAVAEASPVPVIVYHIPYRTGRTLAAPTLAAIAALPGVIGVKQATGAIDAETVALLAEPPPGFAVLAGDDVSPVRCWHSAPRAPSSRPPICTPRCLPR
jgi:4-hydroxy-tetrahydrodipicolinate synthase